MPNYPKVRRPLRIDEQGVHGGVSYQESIVPCREGVSAMLNIGKDIKSNELTYLDDSRSRAVLVCGKRGSGKSYTMGVIVEELLDAGNTLIIIIDPMGIDYPMAQPNYSQERALWDWGINAKGAPTLVLVPGEPEALYGGKEVISAIESKGVRFRQFRVNPADLSPDAVRAFRLEHL